MRRSPANLVNPRKLEWERRQVERERREAERSGRELTIRRKGEARMRRLHLPPQERELKRNLEIEAKRIVNGTSLEQARDVVRRQLGIHF